MNVEGLKLPFIIGSGEMVNLRVRDPYFRPQHLAILKSGNNIVVRDLSGQPTIDLNGRTLSEFVVMDSEAFSVGEILVCEIAYVIDKEDDIDDLSDESGDVETTRSAEESIASHEVEEKTILDNQSVDLVDEEEATQIDQESLDKTLVDSLSSIEDSNKVEQANKTLSNEDLKEKSPEISVEIEDESTKVYELTEAEKTSIMERVSRKPQTNKSNEVVVDGMALQERSEAILNHSQSPMLRPYGRDPKLLRRRRALEANLFWKGKLLQSRQLEEGSTLIVGPTDDAAVLVPQLEKFRELARLERKGLKVNIPKDLECKLLKSTEGWGHVVYNPGLNKGMFALKDNESIVVKIDEDTFLYLRLIPTTKPLSDKAEYNRNLVIWEVFLSSGFVHILLLLLALYLAPISENVPVLDNVPKRYAKLLVKKPEPPKPKPKPPEPKKEPEPPKPEKKKPEPKKLKPKPKSKPKPVKKRKPKKVVLKKKKIKLNKYPLKLKSRTVKPTRKQRLAKDSSKVENKNVKSMGALGALLSTPKPNTNVASVNIDKNAGGPSKPGKTSNVLSAIKTPSGKLANSGATNRVSTKGAGVGDGSSYGVEGLKGSAGAGAIEGTLGRPEIGSFSKSEGLTQKQVLSVVNKHLGDIQRCYEKALISSQGLSGRVEFEWKIGASGKVSSAKVKKAKLSGDGSRLNSCVIALIKKMKFPKAKNGESTTPNIGFPFGRY